MPNLRKLLPPPGTLALLAAATVMLVAGAGDARITIRPNAESHSFFFHASYSREPFDPAESFSLEIWRCASGAMPTFVADRVSLVVCDQGTESGPRAADLVYAVELPGGSCVDHGRSCYYRDPNAGGLKPGIRYFRVQYARRGRGNRAWLQSYGDLSAATQPSMLLLIKVGGQPKALLQDTFTPLPGGGWFSRY